MANSQMPHSAFGGTVSALVRVQHQLPGRDVEFMPVIVAAGQTLQVGSVLGIDSTGKARLSDASTTDGSQDPCAILLEDLDTTLGPQSFNIVVCGSFNETVLIYGPGHTADTVRVPLMHKGIYISAPRYSYA